MIILTIITALITIICSPWKNAWWLHQIQAFWGRCFCYVFAIPVTVRGQEHIRKGQSYVFVSNHQSFYDVFLIYGWLPVVFKWLMKKELRRIPIVGWACKAAGHIFIDRRHARSAAESIQAVEAELKDGVSTVIFPEGTRTSDGSIAPFKRGAFQIALDLNLPVIPLRIDGCYELMPKTKHWPKRCPISLTIGEEMDLTPYKNDPMKAAEVVKLKVESLE